MKYFLDSNIISYLLKGNETIKNKIVELIINDNDISIPAIVYYEVKRGLLASSSEAKIKAFNHFVQLFGITELSMSAIELAAKIYAELKTSGNLIEDDDLFIGCSAVDNQAILITNNERHLSRINGINIEVWN